MDPLAALADFVVLHGGKPHGDPFRASDPLYAVLASLCDPRFRQRLALHPFGQLVIHFGAAGGRPPRIEHRFDGVNRPGDAA